MTLIKRCNICADFQAYKMTPNESLIEALNQWVAFHVCFIEKVKKDFSEFLWYWFIIGTFEWSPAVIHKDKGNIPLHSKTRMGFFLPCATTSSWSIVAIRFSWVYGKKDPKKKKSRTFLWWCLWLNSINRWEFLAVPKPEQLNNFTWRSIVFIYSSLLLCWHICPLA